MGIGRLQCHVIDVNDLAVAEAFWSELTGLPVIPSVFPGRYSYLGQADPWRHEVILHLVRTEKGPEPNCPGFRGGGELSRTVRCATALAPPPPTAMKASRTCVRNQHRTSTLVIGFRDGSSVSHLLDYAGLPH